MGWLDVVLGLLLALNLLSGFRQGFFEEVAGFAGLIAGLFVALAVNDQVACLMATRFGAGPAWSYILGFLLPFTATILVFLWGAKLFTHFFKTLSLGWLNRLAGAAFSFLKGLLILSIVLNLYERVDDDKSLLGAQIARSKLYQPVRRVAPGLFPAFKAITHRDEAETPVSTKTVV
jgi:membrane protein required for colicin V production